MRRRRHRWNRERAVITGCLWVLVALTMAPLALVLIAAFGPSGTLNGGFALPSRLTLANLDRAWQVGQFGESLRASLIVTASVVAIVASLSVLGGYALGILRPVG